MNKIGRTLTRKDATTRRTALLAFGILLVVNVMAVRAAGQQPASGYVLGPDDQIQIHTVEATEMFEQPVLIGTNGNVTLPLVGRIKAAGLTVEQLEAELTTKLRTYMHEPQVSVTVVEFRSQPVSVFGAVTTPGVVQLRGRKTLYEVLSMAGGPRAEAGASLTVTRRLEQGRIPLPNAADDPTKQFSVAEISMQEVIWGKNPATNIEIKPNDVVTVSQANASMVYVVGDVMRAGAFTLGGRQSVSVLGAVSLAGGLGRTARADKARIFREIPGETKHQEIAVNINRIMAGKAEDIGLRPEDVLVVPTSSRKIFTTYVVPAAVAAAVGAVIYAGARY